ncbi:hypothetical protein HPB47_022218, partial [Ixodes persulcatus]
VYITTKLYACGGSIIEPDIVVTAAHCLSGTGPEDIAVKAGILDLHNPPSYSQERGVQKFVIPESYDFPANDIALLKLSAPFDFTESKGCIGAVCLPPKDLPLQNEVDVTGWGYTVEGGPSSSQLLTVKIPTTSCRDEKIMFCAGSPGKGSCQGDSGGPAVQKESASWTLVGVVSGGLICGVDEGVFTRVSAFTDWILENKVKLQS